MMNPTFDPDEEREPATQPEMAGEKAEGRGEGENEGSRAPFADMVIEFASLLRRWMGLTLEEALYAVRANLTDVIALAGLFVFGTVLVLGGVVIFDFLLFRWLRMALDSAEWALFALSLAHVAVGGLLIRAALIRLQGRDDQ